jgi:hypothetical protein
MHKHVATYVATDGSGRSRQYPFTDRAELPKTFDDPNGVTFALMVAAYDVDQTAPAKRVAA